MTMHRTVLIFCVIALIGIMLVMYKHYHRMRLHNDVEQLKKVIALTFKEADKPIISKNRLIKGLKYHLGVNEKMALKLIAKARQEDLIELNRDTLKSSGTVEYSKAF